MLHMTVVTAVILYLHQLNLVVANTQISDVYNCDSSCPNHYDY